MLNLKRKKKRGVFFQRNVIVYICLLQAIRQLQFNAVKKSLLGSVSEDGAVNLWDINTRRLLHGYSDAHIASATGLKFSPLNDILLLSVGLDKRIICFDVQSKKQDFFPSFLYYLLLGLFVRQLYFKLFDFNLFSKQFHDFDL